MKAYLLSSAQVGVPQGLGGSLVLQSLQEINSNQVNYKIK